MTRLLLLLCLSGLLLPGVVAAQNRGCQVTSTPAFDYKDVTDNPTTPVTATSSLTVRCTGNGSERNLRLKVCIGLPSGPRLLGNGGAQLGYNIYANEARTIPWGPRSSGTVPEYYLTLDRGPRSSPYGEIDIPMYGLLAGGQTVTAPGLYTAVLAGAELTASAVTQLPCSSINFVRDTFNIGSRANVPGTCSIAASPLDFGALSDLGAGGTTASSALSVTCTQGLPYRVRLNGGRTGNASDRRMAPAGGPGTVRYELLYRDTGGLRPWGDTDATDVEGTGDGRTQLLPVHGHLPAQATPATGDYEDTVTATVEY